MLVLMVEVLMKAKDKDVISNLLDSGPLANIGKRGRNRKNDQITMEDSFEERELEVNSETGELEVNSEDSVDLIKDFFDKTVLLNAISCFERVIRDGQEVTSRVVLVKFVSDGLVSFRVNVGDFIGGVE